MEKTLLLQIQNSYTQLYNNIKLFISDNFQDTKALSKKEKEFPLKTKKIHDEIKAYDTLNNTLKNNLDKFIEKEQKLIDTILNNKETLEKEVDNSPYLIKRPHLLKYILEIPIQLDVIKSYIEIIKTNIKVKNYSEIELLYTMIPISMKSLDINIK